jgi:hypothetical protein
LLLLLLWLRHRRQWRLLLLWRLLLPWFWQACQC